MKFSVKHPIRFVPAGITVPVSALFTMNVARILHKRGVL